MGRRRKTENWKGRRIYWFQLGFLRGKWPPCDGNALFRSFLLGFFRVLGGLEAGLVTLVFWTSCLGVMQAETQEAQVTAGDTQKGLGCEGISKT